MFSFLNGVLHIMKKKRPIKRNLCNVLRAHGHAYICQWTRTTFNNVVRRQAIEWHDTDYIDTKISELDHKTLTQFE